MKIRKACRSDLETVLSIYRHARQVMRENGNPSQWGNDKPSLEVIQQDIRQDNLYIIEQDGAAAGVFAFITGEDPTYRQIEGAWKNELPYGVIHRLASNGQVKGILKGCLDFCRARISNLRIDTHADNRVMQHLLEKNGFERCGVIYVEDGTPRIAYQDTGSRSICRCAWARSPAWSRYHDEEWGRPVHDDWQLFEMLLLEGQAAGLSFPLILRKREGMRDAYDQFDPYKLAVYGSEKLEALLQDGRVIRNRLKIRAAVENAKAYFRVTEQFGSLDRFLWSYVGFRPIRNIWEPAGALPTRSARSDRLSRDMKKLGFRFAGSVTLFSYMEAVGMYNDHSRECFLYHLGEEDGPLQEEFPYPAG